MLTHANRMEEFARLQQMGFAGVKVDFFESEKQDMIRYYLDILEDAAKFNMLVYFHGCSRAARMGAHLSSSHDSYEAVRGAEWYNNVPDFTMTAPEHNTILAFHQERCGIDGLYSGHLHEFLNTLISHLTATSWRWVLLRIGTC